MSSAFSTSSAFRSSPFAIPGAVLRVAEGVHRGGEARLDGACLLGSSREADIVLTDTGVAPEHVRLRFHGKTVAVDAVGGEVVIKGRAPLALGHGCKVALPVELRVGGACIQLSPDPSPGTFAKRVSVCCGALLVVLTIPMMAFGTNASFGSGPASATTEAAPAAVDATLRTGSIAPASSEPAAVSSLLRPASLRADPLALLRGKAGDAGLSALSFRQDGSHITASGDLPNEKRADWSAIQQWFDGRFGDRFVLTSLATATAEPKRPEFSFQAVWFGPRPYVIDGKGARLYPGAPLGDGWSLKAIGQGRVVVGRNGEELVLTL